MTEALQYQEQVPVEVHAGQTLIVDVKAKGAGEAATGRFEIDLTYADGQATVETVYLTGPRNYPVPIAAIDPSRGHGGPIAVIPGNYTLTLQRPPEVESGPTGRFEVDLTFGEGQAPVDTVYLAGAKNYEVPVTMIGSTQGRGGPIDVAPGDYELTLEQPPPPSGRTRLEYKVQFVKGKRDLTPGGEAVLQKLADFLALPEQSDVTKLIVEVPAEDVGSAQKSNDLAVLRARDVREKLEGHLRARGVKLVYVTAKIMPLSGGA